MILIFRFGDFHYPVIFGKKSDMPDTQLPFFPDGFTAINSNIAFEKRDGKISYTNGYLPLFVHDENDLKAFRFYTAQLVINGVVKQAEIVRAFQVPAITVKRSVKRLRNEGAAGFFAPVERRHGSRLTPEVLPQAQSLLAQGFSVPEISQQLGILPTTLHKAIDSGRLRQSAAVAKKKTRDFAKSRRPRASAQ